MLSLIFQRNNHFIYWFHFIYYKLSENICHIKSSAHFHLHQIYKITNLVDSVVWRNLFFYLLKEIQDLFINIYHLNKCCGLFLCFENFEYNYCIYLFSVLPIFQLLFVFHSRKGDVLKVIASFIIIIIKIHEYNQLSQLRVAYMYLGLVTWNWISVHSWERPMLPLSTSINHQWLFI